MRQRMQRLCQLSLLSCFFIGIIVNDMILQSDAFASPQRKRVQQPSDILEGSAPKLQPLRRDEDEASKVEPHQSRRSLLLRGSCFLAASFPFMANAEEGAGDAESFASIAARASQISKEVTAAQPKTLNSMILPTDKSAFDFTLPVDGDLVPFAKLIRQETNEDGTPKVKAVLVVNIKQDDPTARKAIPELISLAAKYKGELSVVACPTDQGYFEPDTSQLIRLKLASEYGYGINPSTSTTDKVNLLGTGAVPFWRWLQSTCRTPAGLGRVDGNFEKFLLDGATGLPLRRYPRKYRPLNIANDIDAVIAGKQLPPAGANYLEEWRSAAADAERDTYRFEKGLNYFDQKL